MRVAGITHPLNPGHRHRRIPGHRQAEGSRYRDGRSVSCARDWPAIRTGSFRGIGRGRCRRGWPPLTTRVQRDALLHGQTCGWRDSARRHGAGDDSEVHARVRIRHQHSSC